ncbi:MAG: DUF2764 family protein [Bacteroidales bacterium]|nr:DUF2764 family protein [Bacteroidales bacterium]
MLRFAGHYIEQGKLQFGTAEFREELKTGLSKDDHRLMELLFLADDNRNLLTLLLKENRPFLFMADEIKEPEFIRLMLKRFIGKFQGRNPFVSEPFL